MISVNGVHLTGIEFYGDGTYQLLYLVLRKSVEFKLYYTYLLHHFIFVFRIVQSKQFYHTYTIFILELSISHERVKTSAKSGVLGNKQY